jgi:hypothetical protein
VDPLDHVGEGCDRGPSRQTRQTFAGSDVVDELISLADEGVDRRVRRRAHAGDSTAPRGHVNGVAVSGCSRLAIIPTITLGEMELDILNRQVRTTDSVVHLSAIEQSLLYLLASRGGQIVTRDEILDAIWGTDFVAESNIVDRHVGSLRIKLHDDPAGTCRNRSPGHIWAGCAAGCAGRFAQPRGSTAHASSWSSQVALSTLGR